VNSKNQVFKKKINDLKSRMHEMTKADVDFEINRLRLEMKRHLIDDINVEYQEVNIINQTKDIINPDKA
jgi:hypothetical protein